MYLLFHAHPRDARAKIERKAQLKKLMEAYCAHQSLQMCVFITAVPITKLFAWGGRGIEEDCESVSGSGENNNLMTCIRFPLPCPPGLTGTGRYCVVGPAASVRRAALQSSTQPAGDPHVPSRRRRRRRRRSRGGRRPRSAPRFNFSKRYSVGDSRFLQTLAFPTCSTKCSI